jgi:hypothetical protein
MNEEIRTRTIRFRYRDEYLNTINRDWVDSVRGVKFTSIYTPKVGTVYIEQLQCNTAWNTEVFEYLGEE